MRQTEFFEIALYQVDKNEIIYFKNFSGRSSLQTDYMIFAQR
jgi:hypothetical protein